MKMNSLLYLSLCLSAMFVCVLSLSCMSCDQVKCKTPTCKSGVGFKDMCGCCDTCAKTEQQHCGGPWNMNGICDKGLSCVVRRKNGKVIPDRGIGLFSGKCEPNKCAGKSCHIHQTCTVIDETAVCECPRHCKSIDEPVCGLTNGIEYENECQLRKYECKLGKEIGFKKGPCKRCSMGGKPYKFGEKITKGRCESCTCYHGSWTCKNICAAPEPLVQLAGEGARCDISGKKILCDPGMVCQPKPNQSKASPFGICTLEKTTDSLPTPPRLPCPLRKCRPCKYGYIVDDNGCQTCECRTKKSACVLPKQTGPCLAYIPRYYYNPKVGKCMKFIYGGCQPNANNFKTRKACERKCLV
ncbi:four-domain proteases inhibitor-like [Actinia tenebrosa]|uniref:Four-domain proteases inhibitor-like n=1 Tax=Actinia tenebrosa TaxID=6105 RepID=A0A6P8IHV9_ACTTE|nr:four-domain proteases inhibitor-like [Actinia tenebrosa]